MRDTDENQSVESKAQHDEVGLAIATRDTDGVLLAALIFVHHGMTESENVEDCKPAVHLTAREAEYLALNLVRLAHDIRRRQEDRTRERDSNRV